MVRSSTLPWLKRLKKNKCRWLNPEKSTGIFYCKMGRDLCCWEAVDGAREAFIQIAEEIKGHLEKFSDPVHHPVTWTMYMIGRTKETAEPTIMFCCKETCCRQEVRKTIEESGILDKYPGVRAGDSNRPPDFDQLVQLAPESLESTRPNDPESTRILCELQEHKVGKQIWLEGSDGDISRKATAGGLLRVGQKYFYLTVAHVFTERKAMPPLIDTPDGEDFEFDIGGHDDSDQSDEDATDFIETTSRGSITPERTESSSSSDTMASIKDLSTNTPTSKSRTAEDSMMVANSSKLNTPVLLNLGSIIKEDPVKKNATQENTEGQQGVSFRELPEIESVARNADQELNNSLILNVPSSNINAPTTERISEGFLKPTLKTLGELVVSSEDGSRPGLDYALIETQVNTDIQSVNRVLPISGVTPHFSYLSPPQAANRVPLETTVIAITASAGLLKGKMLGTPTFMRVPSSSTYQELWTVRLEGKLAVGDSGSWVVNAHDGTLLGHIVSGSPETGVVYIVPLYQIFEDIGKRLGVKVQLLTVVDLPTPDMPSSASMETSPLRRRGYDTHDTSRDYPPTQEFAHPSEIATNSLVSGFDTVSVSNDSHYIVSYSAPANSGVWSPPTTSTGHEAPSYDQNDIPSPVMSSEVWYKDSKTGELYQDRKDSSTFIFN
jgi:peptide-N4-(N-acetyl-beta-glucosaminyl)asparagine amidase